MSPETLSVLEVVEDGTETSYTSRPSLFWTGCRNGPSGVSTRREFGYGTRDPGVGSRDLGAEDTYVGPPVRHVAIAVYAGAATPVGTDHGVTPFGPGVSGERESEVCPQRVPVEGLDARRGRPHTRRLSLPHTHGGTRRRRPVSWEWGTRSVGLRRKDPRTRGAEEDHDTSLTSKSLRFLGGFRCVIHRLDP